MQMMNCTLTFTLITTLSQGKVNLGIVMRRMFMYSQESNQAFSGKSNFRFLIFVNSLSNFKFLIEPTHKDNQILILVPFYVI